METQTPQSKSKSKKKLKTQQIDTTIQIINEEQAKTPPIIGYFPSGFDPITTNHSSNPPLITTLRHTNRTKRVELVVKPPINSKVDYVGTNYSGEAASGILGVNRLAVVDKLARTITFIPILSNKVFRLEPKVRKADKSTEEPATPAKELSREEVKQGINKMTSMFGTGKSVKEMKRKQRIQTLEDPESQQEMNEVLKHAHVDKSAIESTIKNTNPNLPPHDVTATEPQNAYPLNKIILSGEWNYIDDIFHKLQAGEELRPDVYPSFVCNRSHKVISPEDEDEKKKIAGILSYITHLVNFKNNRSLEGYASAKHAKIPSMLLQKFSKMFLDPVKDRISDDKIEAILSYVLVLTLHIDEFKTDYRDIAKDLKMSAGSLRDYLENLGCKFKMHHKVSVATLSMPLTFVTNVKGKRKRG